MPIAFISDPAKFPPDTDPKADAITWDRFGDRESVDFGGRPRFQATTDKLGNPFEIAIRSGHLAGRRQDGGPSWAGRFADGEALLFTDFSPGPLEFWFENPIRGAGAQVDLHDQVLQVRVGIAAFDKNGTHVGGDTKLVVFSSSGSAPFVGVLDSAAGTRRITRISFFVVVLDPLFHGTASFAINTLRLAT